MESNHTPKQKISRSAWTTLVILGLTQIITLYGETMLLPAIPDIIKDFGITYNSSSWILSAYLIAGAVATPIAARISDIYSRKKMLAIVMMFYIFGIVIGGFSSNITSLIAARIFQGIGIAMFPIAFGIIKDQFPKAKLAIAVGIFTSMSAAGSVVGLALGAGVIENFGWSATFFSILPFAISLWLIIIYYMKNIPESSTMQEVFPRNTKKNDIDDSGKKLKRGNIDSSNRHSSIDIMGTITLAATITSFLLVLSYSGGNIEMRSPLNIGFLSIGSISLVLFVIIERRSESPLVNLHLLTNKVILSANIILLITFLTTFAIFQTIPVLVRSPPPLGFGGEATTVASIQLPFMILFLLFASFSGITISKLGNTKPTILGSLIAFTGFLCLFLFHSTAFLVTTNLAIIAIGLALMRVGGMNIILEATPRQFSGISIGMTAIFKMIGSSIGPAIAGVYMQTSQASVENIIGSFPSTDSYNQIFLTLTLMSIVPVVLATIIMKRQESSPPAHKGLSVEL
jgi:MFS family permease